MKKVKKASGVHVFLDLKGCNKSKLSDVQKLIDILKEAIVISGASHFGYRFKKLDYGGCTVIYLLNESHISIHTFPDSNVAFVDMFTCSDSISPHVACKVIIDRLDAKSVFKKAVVRS